MDIAGEEIRLSIIDHLSDGSLANLIEPIVEIAPLSVVNGAFVNRLIADLCPAGSLLFTVLNPVREQPPRVFGKTTRRNLTFVGRDTGVFSWMTRDFGCDQLFHLPEQPFVPFGGKRIYPKVVAHLLEGGSPATVGVAAPVDSLRPLAIECGEVIHVDNFGICKLFAKFRRPHPQDGAEVDVSVDGREPLKAKFLSRLMAGGDGELLVFPGSSLGGLAEVAVARASASAQVGLKLGNKVSVELRGASILVPPT